MNAIIDTRSFGVCRRKKYNTLDVVPADTLVEFACKVYALCSLTWDYVDTILDLCIELKVTETKPLVRKIRDLKREYDRFRGSSLSSYDMKKEAERGAQIEEYLQKDFDKLFYSLYNDVSRLKLTDGHRRLVIAVQQTMTLMDAVKIYAKDCDRVIESYGTPPIPYSIVQKEFLALYPLIPQFAGDCYTPDISARKITAGIIAQTLKECVVRNKGNQQ